MRFGIHRWNSFVLIPENLRVLLHLRHSESYFFAFTDTTQHAFQHNNSYNYFAMLSDCVLVFRILHRPTRSPTINSIEPEFPIIKGSYDLNRKLDEV
ncbi:hypothetical protein TNCT_664321 [Trichonephila clavata]|uniref:Uncharacterized protein n=1 Tax=Trichonephila clavata TaxID=2740835 RepID=A0A8X6KWH6_TRICU|nr:hypothetical protein TNCT_664321 [Trichonephila clavata]